MSALGERDVVLVRLFAACVLGRFDVVRELRRAAVAPLPDRRWREAVLQVHVFAGFPRLVEAYAVLDEEGGLGAPDPGEFDSAENADERGRELFERIYADKSASVRAQLEHGNALFARWIEAHAYARVLARDGLSADRRELLACAALAALGQERQLASHARGAVRCGASASEVRAAIEALDGLAPAQHLDAARRVVDRFTAR